MLVLQIHVGDCEYLSWKGHPPLAIVVLLTSVAAYGRDTLYNQKFGQTKFVRCRCILK